MGDLIFLPKSLPNIGQRLPREQPVPTLCRRPVIGCHQEQCLLVLESCKQDIQKTSTLVTQTGLVGQSPGPVPGGDGVKRRSNDRAPINHSFPTPYAPALSSFLLTTIFRLPEGSPVYSDREYTPPLNDAGFSITIFPPIPIMAPESNDERDERVARLWETLDTRKEGHVDLSGLKKGLKKIDHRESDPVPCRTLPTDAVAIALKNADDLLRSILFEVDTNHDGQIDHAGKIRSCSGPRRTSLDFPSDRFPLEFRAFINRTESGLWQMFQTIDRNHNGEIDKAELRSAFSQSGVTVSNAKLDEFFDEVDKNNDGVITYAEWRYESRLPGSSE